jgi:beta-N-acetylhexosaminidase
VPFRQAIANGAKAVMMSNASIPGLTSGPASLSYAAVQALRNDLGFTGVIVTDSLSAGAITALHLSVPSASVEALMAGDDLILFGSPTSVTASLAQAAQISNLILKAVHDGLVDQQELTYQAALDLAAVNHLTCASPTTTTTT